MALSEILLLAVFKVRRQIHVRQMLMAWVVLVGVQTVIQRKDHVANSVML
jgi:hypothetical protein